MWTKSLVSATTYIKWNTLTFIFFILFETRTVAYGSSAALQLSSAFINTASIWKNKEVHNIDNCWSGLTWLIFYSYTS